MTFSLTTKLSGVYGGGSFGYGFADASGGAGLGPFYVAHVVLNSVAAIIDPATAQGQASALTELQAIAGATAAASTATNQAAANTLLGQIVSLLQQTAAETLWTDNTGAYFIRVDNPAGGAPTWKTITGAVSAAPGVGVKPAEDRTAPITDKTAYQAIAAAGTTIASGDFVDHFVTTDSVTGAIIGQFWLNSSQGAVLAAAPSTSNLNALSLLPQGAATLAQQQATAGLIQQVLSTLGATLTVKDAAVEAALGTPADVAATGGSTSGSAIAWLRGIFGLLTGTLKTATQSNAPRVSASGPLAAATSVVALAVDGMNAAVIQLAGTWAGMVTWSASVDGGTTFFPINMVPFGGGTAVGFATANGQWEFACGGVTHLQAQMTAWTSGSATALIAAANGLKSIRVGNPTGNPLTVASTDGGLATIGTTTDAATASGATTTVVGALRAIRDKLLGTIAVTGTFYQATQPVSGTFWPATQPVSSADGGLATIGSTTDTATVSGAATTAIGALRAIRDKLLGTIAVTGTFFQATQPVSGTFWQATQPISSTDGSLATIGTTTDAATASGTNTTVVGALRAIRDKLLGSIAVTGTFYQATQPVSSTDGGMATIGSTTDAATVSGANTTAIGALRAIRDKLLGSIAVTGTFYQATQPVSGTFWQATQPASIADGSSVTLGAKVDAAATAASTSGSAIAWLRGIFVAMNAATPAGTNNIGTVGPAPRAPVSGSTTTVAASSTQLWAANTSRTAWTIQAPQSADVWINPLGGAASIGGADCFRIPAGGYAKSTAGGVETSAFTYYCATAGLELAAYQL